MVARMVARTAFNSKAHTMELGTVTMTVSKTVAMTHPMELVSATNI
jgi:hypothetical protein